VKAAAVVVAGGRGVRMGTAVPKQFLPLGSLPLLDRTLHALAACPEIDAIVAALPADLPDAVREAYGRFPKVWAVVDGGAERQDSVRNGLAALPEGTEVVLVHDGVRPLASPFLLSRTVEAAARLGAVVPVVPVTDTVKEWDAGRGTLVTRDRSALYRVQTPQGFRRSILLDAYRKADASGFRGTDDASLVEAAGYPVHPVPGEERNLKITTPEELRMAEGILREEPAYRVGLGGDAHRLVEGRPLWLGGVRIDHPRGLLGHSDGDVLLHAVADAVYGALGEGDIGLHFPPGKEWTKDMDSRRIAAHARGLLSEKGYGLVFLDAVVLCEEPRIAPVAAAIRGSIASLFSVDPSVVGVKGKTTEGMGFEGRGEGISAWVVALLKGRAPAEEAGRERGEERR
jgi:2-C-methyl-D-erythritol 4-phosphate cytidylyltransferase/2-C-methyl-D-erythritol 2,4-cyclodiphosphate synthase